MIEIFWSSGSCPAWRVLLALEFKGVPYESHLLQLSKREHKTDEMLRMNPRGTLPVLRDGEFSLYEGLAILSYLERRFPERPLLGATPEDCGRIMRSIAECLFYVEPAIDALLIPVYRGTARERPSEMREAADKVHEELERLEVGLSGTPWLGGEELSAADLTLVPQLGHLTRALERPELETLDLRMKPLDSRYPKLAAWWQRVMSLPAFDATYPPHWR